MVRASVDDIARNLPGYLHHVEAGETIVVTRGDKPVAEIVPSRQDSLEPRPAGLCSGEFTVPTDFDSPLPDDVLNAFEGK